MKFHWGHGIAASFICFVLLMFFLIYKSMQQEFHLVANDYYDQEIKYQNRINDIENTQRLVTPLIVEYISNTGSVNITYPKDLKDFKGTVNFYRPSNARLDFEVPVNASDHLQTIDVKSIQKGKWQVKIAWTSNNKSYYKEETLFIQ